MIELALQLSLLKINLIKNFTSPISTPFLLSLFHVPNPLSKSWLLFLKKLFFFLCVCVHIKNEYINKTCWVDLMLLAHNVFRAEHLLLGAHLYRRLSVLSQCCSSASRAGPLRSSCPFILLRTASPCSPGWWWSSYLHFKSATITDTCHHTWWSFFIFRFFQDKVSL